MESPPDRNVDLKIEQNVFETRGPEAS